MSPDPTGRPRRSFPPIIGHGSARPPKREPEPPSDLPGSYQGTNTGAIMHGQLVIGLATTLANIAVHAVIMAAVSWAVHGTSLATQAPPPIPAEGGLPCTGLD